MSGGDRPALLSGQRVLAQDFARGLMLLLIVVSNTQFFLWGAEHGSSGWHPTDGNAADSIAQFLMIIFLDLRVFPLFAFLFGYGMMQLFMRRVGAGFSEAQAVAALRRRSLWLMVFGFAHSALLLAGDILGAYGLMSLLLGALLLRASGRTQLVAAGIAMLLLAGLLGLALLQFMGGNAPPALDPYVTHYGSAETSWLASVPVRLGTWFEVTFLGGLLGFAFHTAMLCGFWAARHQILEKPERHRGLLRRTAVFGIGVGVAGGLFPALAHVGAIETHPALQAPYGVFFSLQNLTGVAGGLGYSAALVLFVSRLPEGARRSVPVTAIAASGKRALSSYLCHSILFVPMLSAWGLGLGQHLGSASMAFFAAIIWASVVAACYGLERLGHPGPAEVALRIGIYGVDTARPSQ